MKPNTKRLLKLARHLEHGKLAHKVFNYGVYNSGEGSNVGCGTYGCAIGECPTVFPEWHWGESKRLCYPMIGDMNHPFKSSIKFFDLTKHQAEHLFLPNFQRPSVYGGKYLDETATRHDVAANIRAFVRRMNRKHKSK